MENTNTNNNGGENSPNLANHTMNYLTAELKVATTCRICGDRMLKHIHDGKYYCHRTHGIGTIGGLTEDSLKLRADLAQTKEEVAKLRAEIKINS